MSLLTLPEPAGWASSARRLTWVTVAGFVPAVLAVGFAMRSLLRGSYFTGLVTAGLGACFALVAIALQLVRRGRTSLRAKHDSTGTTLLPGGRFSALVLASLLLATSSMLAIAIAVPLNGLDISMSQGMKVLSPFVAGFGALVGLVGLTTVWRRGGVGYVDFTTDGVDIANVAFTESVDWNDIADVRDSADSKKSRRAVVLVLRDGSEKLIDGADIYVPRGSALYWMVRHYWLRPEDRSELTDGRALDRLRKGRFETT